VRVLGANHPDTVATRNSIAFLTEMKNKQPEGMGSI